MTPGKSEIQQRVPISQMGKGMQVEGFYLVRNMNIKTSANNKAYGDYTLGDQTGEINAKLWDVSEPDKCPKVGDFIKVRGLVTEWQGKLQLRMDRFRPVQPEDGVTLDGMVPAAPESPQAMVEAIESYVARIDHIDIKSIVTLLLDEKRPLLAYYPAALKNHHAIRAGLAFHTLSMLRMADGVLAVYDFLDKDLVYAGVILHDLAKTDELEAGESGVAVQYSVEGMLLGHISQGVMMIGRAGETLGCDKEVVTLLQHMILAHHYEPEFGSPKRPAFPEAEVLHYLDVLDARMYDMHKILENQEEGTFSDSIWTLHNRRLYKKTF